MIYVTNTTNKRHGIYRPPSQTTMLRTVAFVNHPITWSVIRYQASHDITRQCSSMVHAHARCMMSPNPVLGYPEVTSEGRSHKPFDKMSGPSGVYSIPYVGMALMFQPFGKIRKVEKLFKCINIESLLPSYI